MENDFCTTLCSPGVLALLDVALVVVVVDVDYALLRLHLFLVRVRSHAYILKQCAHSKRRQLAVSSLLVLVYCSKIATRVQFRDSFFTHSG